MAKSRGEFGGGELTLIQVGCILRGMTDRRVVDGPIDLDVLEQGREGINQQVDALQEIIQEKLGGQVPILGHLLLGATTKEVQDERGRTRRVPITMDDIHEHMDRVQLEAEEADRQEIVKKARAAVEAQESHFASSGNKRRKARSQETAGFARAMMDRFLALPLPNAGWEWQERDPKFVRTEKVLQDYIEITFSGTPALWHDTAADLAVSVAALKVRHNATWDSVVRNQGKLFKKYIDEVMLSNARTAQENASLLSRLVRNGEPVYSDEQIQSTSVAALEYLDDAYGLMEKDFSDVLPYFQARAGSPITFHDLLVPKPQK